MKIVHITPSSGGSFYCENCLRDAEITAEMHKLGENITILPMYLPLTDDQQPKNVSSSPIFFGGINVWLQQKSSIFRKTPRWFDKLLDSPHLLGFVARMAGMTSAKELAETTISMLQGEHGKQKKELDRLLDWLVEQEKPEVVVLSNILLIGLAEQIKTRLGCSIVILLQDEDGFIDGLGSSYAKQAWDIVAAACTNVDLFIAVSNYFASVMQKKLRLDPVKLKVIYPGIRPAEYNPAANPPAEPTIGFLSRQSKINGLDILADAFIKLKKNPSLKYTRLRVSGGKNSEDTAFIESVEKKLQDAGVFEDVDFLPDFDKSSRVEFLQSLTVLAVPQRFDSAYGLFVVEALACAVPVVQPDCGVFPELLDATGGGLLYKQGQNEAFVAALEQLLLAPDYAAKLGKTGRDVVAEKYNIEKSAARMIEEYKKIQNTEDRI